MGHNKNPSPMKWATLAPYGGSSYIDSVILRDRDNSSKWSQASDGTLETRHYYAQNWRADVSVIFDNSGAVLEWQKYSAYGTPYLLTPGDHNKDGVVNSADSSAFNNDYTNSNLRADLNRDGVLTTADQTLFNASYGSPVVGGRGKLSSGSVANRKGYAGYEHEGFGNDPPPGVGSQETASCTSAWDAGSPGSGGVCGRGESDSVRQILASHRE